MKTIPVLLKSNPYSIVVGNNILPLLGNKIKQLKIGSDAVIITNPVIIRNHGKALIKGLKKNGISVKVFEVPPGEKSKSATTSFQLIEKIAKYACNKEIFIIAFGGGVIGDLAGYVAAIYKRGVPYIQVPTTLLAQVDSAIGGKVAIDLTVGKNLVGAFYQPKIVWSDVSVLSTLPKRQMRNGLAEIIKYGIIADRTFFDYLTKNFEKILSYDNKALHHAIERSSQIKRDVVVLDERETTGLRATLNFGHTVGHAIEAAGNYTQYHHGEAIALGMRVAAGISLEKKMCSLKDVENLDWILSGVGLPKNIVGLTMKDIFKHMKHDKKFIAGENRFVLMSQIGKVKIVKDIPLEIIRKAINSYWK